MADEANSKAVAAVERLEKSMAKTGSVERVRE
jgi:hypothetical protein